MVKNLHKYFWSCDWGSSSFRLFLVNNETGAVLKSYESQNGITELSKTLSSDQKISNISETYLNEQVSSLTKATGLTGSYPCVLSGMITSAHGWQPLEYSAVPFNLSGESLTFKKVPSTHSHIDQLFFLSGVRTQTDVMRGEEAEIIGYFQLDEYKDFSENATVVIPGTHSKHVHVENNMITDFKTYMTGELFDLLCTHSVLKFNVSRKKSTTISEAFIDGVKKGGDSTLLNSLFSVRTNDLFKVHSQVENADFLSGLLIGNEIRALKDQTSKIMLYAKGQLLEMYKAAMQVMGMGESLLCINSAKVASISGHHAFLKTNLGNI
ncbi:MAG: 2-dehydro-3-deoxygalactonokinase [Lentisphaeraceae bacterium]|nr:2-dehydro-3-deoxygalactonokinase [Lentisphaeraceae bacterium]